MEAYSPPLTRQRSRQVLAKVQQSDAAAAPMAEPLSGCGEQHQSISEPEAAGGQGDVCGQEDAERRLPARTALKNIKEAESTGESPLNKKNRRDREATGSRELKLSAAETAMSGAPQGPVYQVDVLESDQFSASPNPDEELQAMMAGIRSEVWADQYAALDSVRRLSLFHRQELLSPGCLQTVVPFVCQSVTNLRSATVRNALLCCKDMFSCLGPDLGAGSAALVECLLQRTAGDKKFICQAAVTALEQAAKAGPSAVVLGALLAGVDDKNPEVQAKASVHIELCLSTLGVGATAGAGMPSALDVTVILQAMHKALAGKVPEGRTSARRAMLRCRKALGPVAYEEALRGCVGQTAAELVLRQLATQPQKAGGPLTKIGSRPNVKERLMASQRSTGSIDSQVAALPVREGEAVDSVRMG